MDVAMSVSIALPSPLPDKEEEKGRVKEIEKKDQNCSTGKNKVIHFLFIG